MKISVDKEGQIAIQELCDVALKSGGMANLPRVGQILASVTIIETESSSESVKENSV